MTVSSTNRTAGPFAGTGSQTVFPFGFKVFTAADVLVTRVNTVTQLQSTLTLSSDYTVSLNADQDAAPGGTVTLLGGALAAGYTLGITSSIAPLQTLALTNNGGFYPKAIEAALDRIVILLQQLGVVSTGQTLRAPEASGIQQLPPAPQRAGMLLGFDSAGQPAMTLPASGSAADVMLQLASPGVGKGSKLLAFVQRIADAVAQWTEDKLAQRVSVLDFATDSQRVSLAAGTLTDMTSAWQKALAAAAALRVTGAATISYGSTIKIKVPPGKQKITAALTLPAYCEIEGERSALIASSAIDIFSGVGFNTRIRGLTFHGGTRGIAIATGNVDTTTVEILECEFHDQTVECIGTDDNSASTILNIERCKFVNFNTAAHVLNLQCVDICNFVDSWVSAKCLDIFVNGSAVKQAQLQVRGLMGVPLTGGATQCWFKNYSKLKIVHSRFGGEFSGCVLVKNYAPLNAADANVIDISGCEVFATDPAPVVQFYRLPNIFAFENNNGLYNSGGFLFDSGAQADILNYSPQTCIFRVAGNGIDTIRWRGDSYVALRAMLMSGLSEQHVDDSVRVSEVALQIPINSASYTPSGGASEVAAVGSTGIYGNPTSVITSAGGAAGDDGYWYTVFGSALSGFTADAVHTMCVPVEVSGIKPMTVQLEACGQTKRFHCAPGRHVLCMPFVYSALSATPNRVGVAIYDFWSSAGQIAVGTIRLLFGLKRVRTENLVAYGSAAPATGYWLKGDRVINVPPVAGQPKAWVCTVAGTPGTWVSEGNL